MVKKIVLLILVIIAFVLLELNYPRFLTLFGIRPDLFVIFVIFFSLRLRKKYAILFSGSLGFIKDIFSFAKFGTTTISFVICSLVIDKIKSSIYQDEYERLLQLVMVFSICLLNSVLFYFINIKAISAELSFFKSLFFIMLPEALYTTAISPLIFHIFKKCDLDFLI